MTREEAIRIQKWLYNNTFLFTSTENDVKQSTEMAIKALEQDPDAIHNEREQAYMKGYEDASKRFRTEPCEDAISRQAVLDLIADYDLSMGQVVRGIHDLPSVSVAEKVGEWEMCEDADGLYGICSVCGVDADFRHYGIAYKWCPNCGAKMEAEQ